MTNLDTGPMIHLTPAERYFMGEISLAQATSEEVRKMQEERRETRSGAANVVIRVLTLLVAIPLLAISVLNPRRWC